MGLATRQATALALVGVFQAVNNLPEAEATLEEATRIANHCGDALIQGRILEKQGTVYAMRQNFVAARDKFLTALEVLRPLRTPEHPQCYESQNTQFVVVSNLGQAYQALGQLDQALAVKYEALEMAYQHDEYLTIAHAHSDIAEILCLMNKIDDARTHFQDSIISFRKSGANSREIIAQARLKELH